MNTVDTQPAVGDGTTDILDSTLPPVGRAAPHEAGVGPTSPDEPDRDDGRVGEANGIPRAAAGATERQDRVAEPEAGRSPAPASAGLTAARGTGRALAGHGHEPSGVPAADHARPASDYAPPRALSRGEEVIYDESAPEVESYAGLGRALAATCDLYRDPAYGAGLIVANPDGGAPPFPVREAADLAPVIVDRLRVRVVKDGKPKGGPVPAAHLKTMLRSEAFLQQFRAVDRVVTSATYLGHFTLTAPGYNDGGAGQRVLYVGGPAAVLGSLEHINKFLDVMDFESAADRTNAVAAALTVVLRNFWPGEKPLVAVTSTKSHGGKDTVITFARGTTPSASISYQDADWATERSFVGAVKHDPGVGVVAVENARPGRGQATIRSAFLERHVTSPDLFLFSTGSGAATSRRNDLVVAISTNHGTLSEDLLNRSLPVHLTPVGDVAARRSPIGNPRYEYLPAHAEAIEAELRGMVERWKAAGRPLDSAVRHPFTDWARTVGGILGVNGFTDFLGNSGLRKTADDPAREALGRLGASRPGESLRAAEWVARAASLGLVKAVIAEADRGSEAGRERGMGVTLSNHAEETFLVETEDERLTLRLRKQRKRYEPGAPPTTRYRFDVESRDEVPEDPAGRPGGCAPAP